ncbi:MAG: hypothetical protein KAH01_00645 [Caldisericia bacterium]|nr:hypothetical protein [Caldisericia bacterium]
MRPKNKNLKNTRTRFIWIGLSILVLVLVYFCLKPLLKHTINADYINLNKTTNEVVIGSKEVAEFNAVWERFRKKYNNYIFNACLSNDSNIEEYWINTNQLALEFTRNVDSRDKFFCFKDGIVDLAKKYSISNPEISMERLRKLINDYAVSAKNKDVAGIIEQYPEVYREFNMLLPMLRRTEAIEIGLLLDNIYKLGFSNKPEFMPGRSIELSDAFYSQYFTFKPVFEP